MLLQFLFSEFLFARRHGLICFNHHFYNFVFENFYILIEHDELVRRPSVVAKLDCGPNQSQFVEAH